MSNKRLTQMNKLTLFDSFIRNYFNPVWHHMAFRLPMLRFTYAGCQTRKYFPAQIIAAAFRITI